jgi:hypothetical protein
LLDVKAGVEERFSRRFLILLAFKEILARVGLSGFPPNVRKPEVAELILVIAIRK